MTLPNNGRRRVVVTGMGAMTANAHDLTEFLASLRAGTDGIKAIDQFCTKNYLNHRAGAIDTLVPTSEDLDEMLDRAEQLALAVSREAVADSGFSITAGNSHRCAVALGTSLGGWNTYIDAMRLEIQCSGETLRTPAHQSLAKIPPCRVAQRICGEFGITGGSATTVTACAAGANSIALGLDMIRRGRVDTVLAVAADPLSELPFSGFNVLQALSSSNCRPFDRDRGGLVMGEGAGALVLEELETAVARGANIYCEIAGYGLSSDAFHATQPDPEAGGASRAIRRALADSQVLPVQMEYINAHGTATRHNDAMELKAIQLVYGELAASIPISSIKAMIGHTLGAAGTIEAIATVLSLHHGFLPPTINFASCMEGYEYDFVPIGRPIHKPKVMSSHSFGFGGNAACLLFRAYSSETATLRADA